MEDRSGEANYPRSPSPKRVDKDPNVADVLRALLLHMEVSKAKEKAERQHLGLSVKQLSTNMQRLADAIDMNTTRVSSAIDALAVRMEPANPGTDAENHEVPTDELSAVLKVDDKNVEDVTLSANATLTSDVMRLPGIPDDDPNDGTDLNPLLPDGPGALFEKPLPSARSIVSSEYDKHFKEVQELKGATLHTHDTLKPEYKPTPSGQWLPCVEVSVKIIRLNSIDIGSLTFDCDFVLHLDWDDQNLDGFVGNLAELDWQKRLFNPEVIIENARHETHWLKGKDDIPRWFPSKTDPNRWLRKTMRYRGELLMKEADMRCFPFDLQLLPIHIVALPCHSLGKVVKTNDGTQAPKDACNFVLKESLKKTLEDDYTDALCKGCGHFLTREAGNLLVDFFPRHVGRCSMHSGGHHQVNVFLQRPWFGSYTRNILFFFFLTGVSMSSFYADWSSLASRMGITLLVILIITVGTRPDCIAKVPYTTFFDKCLIISLATSIFISLSNIYTVMQCGGYDAGAISFLQERYQNDSSSCEQGWCDSTKLDCMLILITCVLWFLANAAVVVWECICRRRMVQRMQSSQPSLDDQKKLEDSPDNKGDPGKSRSSLSPVH